MQNFMENCWTKSVMSGVMGFGMGGLFGMFMASVSSPPHSLLPSTRSFARTREIG